MPLRPTTAPPADPATGRGRAGAPLAAVVVALCAGLLALLPALPAAAAAPSATAYIRVAHLVPGFGPVTMSATLTAYDGKTTPMTLVPSAAYGAVSGYAALPVGYYSIAVRPVGAAASSPPVLTGSLQATAGGAYTIAGLGSPTSPRIGTITDDIARPADGKARVRVINAAVPGKSAQVTTSSGTQLAAAATFGTPTDYLDVAAGSTTVTASADGRTTTSPVDLVAGDVFTLLLLDDGKGGLVLRPVIDAAGPSTAPVGGAATGGGGLATARTGGLRALPLAAGGAVVTAAGAAGLVLAVRRPRTRRRAGARRVHARA